MGQNIQSQCCTVLEKSLRGENNVYLRVLCEHSGLLLLIKKVSATKTSSLPDFFDDISFEADKASMGDILFLRSHELILSRADLAKDFCAFSYASQIANLALKNAEHLENIATFSKRLRLALNSLAKKNSPSSVYIKFLYLMARDEGYAVVEDFYAKLAENRKNLFTVIIRSPVEDLRQFESRAAELAENFNDWILSNTDIRLG